MNINYLLEWVREKPRARSVEIKISATKDAVIPVFVDGDIAVSVWVYDSAVCAGTYLRNTNELVDLEKEKFEQEAG